MFLELTVSGLRRDSLSWVLCKHPERVFELKMSGGRVVKGKWLTTTDDTQNSSYQLTVDMLQDDKGVAFLREMKRRNKSFYVNVAQSAISPHTIVCIRDALKNALKGHHGPEAATAGNTAYPCSALFGPWSVPVTSVKKFMTALDLSVLMPDGNEFPKGRAPNSPDNVLRITSSVDMTVTQFLQKLYVGATLLTHKQHVGDRWEWQQKLDALALYTTGWQHQLSQLPPWAQRLISHTPLTQEQLVDQKIEQRSNPGNTVKVTMHERRHAWIVNTIVKLKPNTEMTIVDYGCASGKLSRQLLNTFPSGLRLFAVDVTQEEVAMRTWRHRSLARATFVRSNLLYPIKLLELLLADESSHGSVASSSAASKGVDILVLTEVIEHLEPRDRARLVSVIVDTLRPRHALITTPNRSYNVHIPNLCANGWRHSDHRIEFDAADWQREVVTPFLDASYSYEEAKLGQDDLMPSFCGLFTLCQSEALDKSSAFGRDKREASPPVGEGSKASRKVFDNPVRERWLQAHRHMRDTIFHPLTIKGLASQDAVGKHGSKDASIVASSVLAAGVMTPEFVMSADHVFYRAPTLAPVEHHASEPNFLEHPIGAYEYYRKRGIQSLWAEHKYMGSRAHMLVFVDQEAAHKAHWPGKLLTIISRSGREFFGQGAKLPSQIEQNPQGESELPDPEAASPLAREHSSHQFLSLSEALLPFTGRSPSRTMPDPEGRFLSLSRTMPDMPPAWLPFLQSRLADQNLDFAILDAEILPWSLKAGSLIEQQFRQPGLCALASRTHLFGADSDKTQRAQLFMDALECYTQDVNSYADIQARVFDVIACGVADVPNGFCPEQHGYVPYHYGDVVKSEKRYALIDAMCQAGESVGILPVERMFVDLNDQASMDACTQAWLKYTALPGNDTGGVGGEGMVFKTHPTLREKHNDALVQPALKVRGRDYLRLIYGIDYLMPECFALVKHRKVAVKRLLALKQTLLGRMILDAFLSGNTEECMRCQAAFCGEGHCCTVDATL